MSEKSSINEKFISSLKYNNRLGKEISNFKKNINRYEFRNFYKNPEVEISKDLILIKNELEISDYLENKKLKDTFDEINLNKRRCALLYLKTEGNLAISKYREIRKLESIVNEKKGVYKKLDIDEPYFVELINNILDEYISVRYGVLDSKKTSIAIKTVESVEKSFEDPSKRLNKIASEAGENMLKYLPNNIDFTKKIEKRNLLRETNSDNIQQLIGKINSEIDEIVGGKKGEDEKIKKYLDWVLKINKIENNNHAAFEAIGKINCYLKKSKSCSIENSIEIENKILDNYLTKIAYNTGYLYSLQELEKNPIKLVNKNEEIFKFLKNEYFKLKENLNKEDLNKLKKEANGFFKKIKNINKKINERCTRYGIKKLKSIDIETGEKILSKSLGKNWKKKIKQNYKWNDKNKIELIKKLNYINEGESKKWKTLVQLLSDPLEDIILYSINDKKNPKYRLVKKSSLNDCLESKNRNMESSYLEKCVSLSKEERNELLKNTAECLYNLNPKKLKIENIKEYFGESGSKILFKSLAEKSLKNKNIKLGIEYLDIKENKIEGKKEGFIASKFMTENLSSSFSNYAKIKNCSVENLNGEDLVKLEELLAGKEIKIYDITSKDQICIEVNKNDISEEFINKYKRKENLKILECGGLKNKNYIYVKPKKFKEYYTDFRNIECVICTSNFPKNNDKCPECGEPNVEKMSDEDYFLKEEIFIKDLVEILSKKEYNKIKKNKNKDEISNKSKKNIECEMCAFNFRKNNDECPRCGEPNGEKMSDEEYEELFNLINEITEEK